MGVVRQDVRSRTVPVRATVKPGPRAQRECVRELAQRDRVIRRSAVVRGFASPTTHDPCNKVGSNARRVNLAVIVGMVVSGRDHTLTNSVPTDVMVNFIDVGVVERLTVVAASSADSDFLV